MIRCHFGWKICCIEQFIKQIVDTLQFFGRTINEHTGRILCGTVRNGFFALNRPTKRVFIESKIIILCHRIGWRRTYFISLSHLFPAITIGTLGKFFFERPDEPDMALNLVSNICSLNRITSSNDSLESMLKHSTKRSPKNKRENA